MLQSQFIHMSNNPADYGHYAVDKKILKQMPSKYRISLFRNDVLSNVTIDLGLARYYPIKNGKVIIDLSGDVVNGILAQAEDEQIRKDVYTAGYQPDGTHMITIYYR